MKVSKTLLAGVIVGLVGVFAFGASWYRDRHESAADGAAAAAAERLERPYSISLGPPGAPVTIVEFFDPECEACRAMYPIVKQVLADFGDNVRLVIRYMPLHGNSVYASTLLEAARDQGRYWEYLDIIMERQPEWASHAAPRPELLLTYAPMAGLDVEQLRLAATNPELGSRIEQDREDGLALGANRTPTIFVNGRPLLQLGYGPLRVAVERALEQ